MREIGLCCVPLAVCAEQHECCTHHEQACFGHQHGEPRRSASSQQEQTVAFPMAPETLCAHSRTRPHLPLGRQFASRHSSARDCPLDLVLNTSLHSFLPACASTCDAKILHHALVVLTLSTWSPTGPGVRPTTCRVAVQEVQGEHADTHCLWREEHSGGSGAWAGHLPSTWRRPRPHREQACSDKRRQGRLRVLCDDKRGRSSD
jgi:hypothetical protein